MNRNKFLTSPEVGHLLQELNEKKPAFLKSLKSRIKSHISSQRTSDCLSLVIRSSSGYVLENVPAAPTYGYAEKLYYFCRQKSFGSRTIDSILTDQVVDIFTSEYDKFVVENIDDINQTVLQVLLRDEIVVARLRHALLNNNGIRIVQTNIKRSIVDRMLEGVIQQFDGPIQAAKAKASAMASAAITKAAVVASAAVSAGVGKVLIAKFTLFLVAHLKLIIMRALATPAIKAAVVIAVKKVVVAAVLAAFVHMLAAKMSIGLGAALAWVLVPLILAFLIKEWWFFPEKIGDGIGDALTKDMDRKFQPLIEQLLVGVFDQVTDFGISELEKQLLTDVEIAGLVNAVAKELTSEEEKI